MSRLIDADKTIDTLKSLGCRDYRREKGTIADAIKMISSDVYTPTVDAVPVVHGEWVWTERGEDDYEQYYVCSECGSAQYFETTYCPNCGAKMDGERREDNG